MLEKVLFDSLIYYTPTWVLASGLFAFMLCCIYIGRKVGMYRKKTGKHDDDVLSNTTMSAMFGLLAFVLAFTFGMSSSRFDARRSVIVNEANAIGTALLRADMYIESERENFRREFGNYINARILYHKAHRDLKLVMEAKRQADSIGKKIWGRATVLSREPTNESATRQMIPALNEMFDLNNSRLMGELAKVPSTIVWMLFVLSWASAFYLGYSSAKKEQMDWLLATGFCLLISVVIYITLDLDRPRRGVIQLDTPHQAMEELSRNFELH